MHASIQNARLDLLLPPTYSVVAPQDREMYLTKVLELRLTDVADASGIIKVGPWRSLYTDRATD